MVSNSGWQIWFGAGRRWLGSRKTLLAVSVVCLAVWTGSVLATGVAEATEAQGSGGLVLEVLGQGQVEPPVDEPPPEVLTGPVRNAQETYPEAENNLGTFRSKEIAKKKLACVRERPPEYGRESTCWIYRFRNVEDSNGDRVNILSGILDGVNSWSFAMNRQSNRPPPRDWPNGHNFGRDRGAFSGMSCVNRPLLGVRYGDPSEEEPMVLVADVVYSPSTAGVPPPSRHGSVPETIARVTMGCMASVGFLRCGATGVACSSRLWLSVYRAFEVPEGADYFSADQVVAEGMSATVYQCPDQVDWTEESVNVQFDARSGCRVLGAFSNGLYRLEDRESYPYLLVKPGTALGVDCYNCWSRIRGSSWVRASVCSGSHGWNYGANCVLSGYVGFWSFDSGLAFASNRAPGNFASAYTATEGMVDLSITDHSDWELQVWHDSKWRALEDAPLMRGAYLDGSTDTFRVVTIYGDATRSVLLRFVDFDRFRISSGFRVGVPAHLFPVPLNVGVGMTERRLGVLWWERVEDASHYDVQYAVADEDVFVNLVTGEYAGENPQGPAEPFDISYGAPDAELGAIFRGLAITLWRNYLSEQPRYQLQVRARYHDLHQSEWTDSVEVTLGEEVVEQSDLSIMEAAGGAPGGISRVMALWISTGTRC